MALGIFAAGMGDYVQTGTVGGFNALTSPIIVVGNSVDSTDTIAAADIAAAVAGYATTTVSTGAGASVAVSNGADVSTADNKLYMGSVLNKVKSTLTSMDLPTLLAQGTVTVSGTDYKYDQYVKLGPYSTVTYGTVTAANILDPVVYMTTGSSTEAGAGREIYNLTVVFNKPLNISSSKVQGKTLTLFGTDYTIGSGSGATTATLNYSPLILYGYGATETLTVGTPVTINIGGTAYAVEATFIGSNQLLLKVGDVTSDTLAQGDSDSVGGLNVYVKSILYSGVAGTNSLAVVGFGANKVTLTTGSTVTLGSSTTVDGTYVGLSGDSTGLSSIVVSIAAKDSTNAYIQGGQAFTDPVFGSFKVAFNGLTPSLSDSSRDAVTVTASNTQTSASLKDYKGNAKTLNFANIDSSNVLTLNASVTQAIHVVENEVVNLNDYFLFAPTQESEFGHILKLSSVSGIGGSSPKFTLEDTTAGTSTEYTLDSAMSKTIYIDGQAIAAQNATATGTSMKFSWGSGSTKVVYPLVKLKNGEYMTFITNVTLAQNTLYEIPGNLSFNLSTTMMGDVVEAVTAGRITYNFVNTSAANAILRNITTSGGTLMVDEFPAVLILQEQANSTNKNVITAEVYPRDGTNHYIGVRAPVMSDGTTLAQWNSDTYMYSAVDLFGTYVTRRTPTSAGETVTVNYPDTQAIATVGVGTNPSFAVGGAGTVQQAVKIQSPVAKFASEVSTTAPGADVILVGGPCANSLAAAVLAGQNITCSNWAYTTGIIKEVTGAFTDGKKALVVAGTLAADTRALAAKVMQGTLSFEA